MKLPLAKPRSPKKLSQVKYGEATKKSYDSDIHKKITN